MILDIAKELQKTLHLHSNELPYVTVEDGVEFRILHARADDNYYVTQLRVQPGFVGGLHKHSFSRGASGFTLRGAWGHDHQYLYRPGTYIFETPGVIHQLLNGPEESEILFFGDFALDYVDPETLGVRSVVTADMILNRYLEQCEERGITPNYLK
jgi:2,4'-dihydroxyacetophenone dioxygenase